MINVAILMGRLTSNPELRTTPNGVSACRFTIAVDRNYAKQGAERQVDFINCVAWRQTAEFVSRYFVKGQLVAVNGSIQTGSYTDNNGNKKYTFEILANSVSFTGDKRNESGNTSKANANTYTSVPTPENTSNVYAPVDDDLPF